MIYKSLTKEVLNFVTESISETKRNRLREITPGVLFKIILTRDTIIRSIILDLEGDIEGMLNQIEFEIKNNPLKYDETIHEEDLDTSFSTEMKSLFETAHSKAMENKDKYLALDVLFFAGCNKEFKPFIDSIIDIDMITDALVALRGDRKITEKDFKEQSFLNKFCTNINEKFLAGEIDHVFGRIDEIDRVSNILSKRTKNNPILVGEPGTGKTAIVEGMAGRIINGEIESLKDTIIWSLDLTTLAAGAGQKGEIEKRMSGLIKEIQRKNNIMDTNIVLFIDEIHLIVDPHGGMDLANILKPVLARGTLKTIGATTLKEYQKYFEKDPAIQRRFQIVKVSEPTEEESLVILRGIREKIESYHNLKIDDDALISAVKLSKRYITDRFLPDKAIDLLDEASSSVSNKRFIEGIDIKKLRQEISEIGFKISGFDKIINDDTKEEFRLKIEGETEELKLKEDKLVQELHEKENDFKAEKDRRQMLISMMSDKVKIEDELFRAKAEINMDKIIDLESNVLPDIEKNITELSETFSESIVQEFDIAEVLFNWTGIPVDKIQESDSTEKIINIKEHLQLKVQGQDEALDAVSNVIRRNKAGLSKDDKPIGTFMFLGPTGVGKTETAKALSETVFGSVNSMIRFDMSEFMESHTVSKLIGSPAGYVGHDDGGVLTNAVKNNPYSIILFDEIEKAHPKIFDILLQVLDDGILRDGKGQVIDFKNTIIILTSNIGGMDLAKIPNIEVKKQEAIRVLQKTYRPEFINRLDEIVVFNPLEMEALAKIINHRLDVLTKELWETRYINLVVTNEFKANIIANIDIAEFGARPINRLISSRIETPITDYILSNSINSGDDIVFDLVDGESKVTVI